MSWSSLFAFPNANGRIGSKYTAVNTPSTSVSPLAIDGDAVGIATYQTIASFTSLPVGVYSVSVSFPTATTTAGTFDILSWSVGAGSGFTTALNASSLGSTSIIGFPTANASVADTSSLVVNFILTNTSATSPIYINSVSDIPSNTAMTFGVVSANAVVVATKLA